jgi:hypothetical protein
LTYEVEDLLKHNKRDSFIINKTTRKDEVIDVITQKIVPGIIRKHTGLMFEMTENRIKISGY